MSLRINTNMNSLLAQRQLSQVDRQLAHSMGALASGSRIRSASDDAAGLAISEGLKAESQGNRMAKRNAEDAISLVQIGEGSLNEVNNILVRLRELGVQSASGTIGDTEREFIDTEAQQLLQEIDRIAESTRFGGYSLLDGSANDLEFQVGTDSSASSVISYRLKADATTSSLDVSGLDLTSMSDSRDALDDIDSALVKVGEMRSSFGALQNRLDSAIANLDVNYENITVANSRIRDADIAVESAKMTSQQIRQQATIGVLSQANQSHALALKLVG